MTALMNRSAANPLRGALKLGGSNAFDYALQFALPVILARSLSSEQFGEYRLLWLITNTLMGIAPLYMPQSLFYFLPRHEGAGRAGYVANVFWFLVASGVLATALGALYVNHVGPSGGRMQADTLLISCFLCMWVISSLIEWLANAEGRVGVQAVITVSLSLARTLLVGPIAWWSGDIVSVYWALACFAALRLVLLLWLIVGRYGTAGLLPDWRGSGRQLTYAMPFGIAGGLYVLRQQADQWIVASLFDLTLLAAMGVAGVVAPLAGLVRQAISNAVLPAMNRSHGQGDSTAAIRLNRQSNSLTAVVLMPIVAFLFVFAEEVISLVYTPTYVAAAQPMRVYLLGLLGQTLVVNNLLIIYAQGRFQLRVNLIFLGLSVVLSLIGALQYGLAGAAFGTAVAQWGSHLVSIRRVMQLTACRVSAILDLALFWQAGLAVSGAAGTAWLLDRAGVLAVEGALWHLILAGAVFCVPLALAAWRVPRLRAAMALVRRST